jgi:hypothetical protein
MPITPRLRCGAFGHLQLAQGRTQGVTTLTKLGGSRGAREGPKGGPRKGPQDPEERKKKKKKQRENKKANKKEKKEENKKDCDTGIYASDEWIC